MTIIEAINKIDNIKPSSYSQEQKVQWLSKLDGMVKTQIIDTHEGGEGVAFAGYTEQTPLNTVLLVPAPFENVYLLWLESQIDYHNGEYSKYNNAVTLFNTEYSAYRNDYNRKHMPKGEKIRFF